MKYTWEALGLTPNPLMVDGNSLVPSMWTVYRGLVAGMYVHIEFKLPRPDRNHPTEFDHNYPARTLLTISGTGYQYDGHLTPDRVAELVLAYARRKVPQVEESVTYWRNILAEAERTLA